MASQPDTALSGSVIATIVIFASLAFLLLLLLLFIVKCTYLAHRARRGGRRARDPERGLVTPADRHERHRGMPTQGQGQEGAATAAADVVFRPAPARHAQRPRSMPVYRADGPLPAERVQPATPERLDFEVGEDKEGAAAEPGGFLAPPLWDGRRRRSGGVVSE